MFFAGFLFFVPFLKFVNCVESGNITTLRLVQVMWRHGDRTPRMFLKNDPENGPESWPEGLGELTNRGRQQAFALGQHLIQRYGSLLNYTYNSTQVRVISGALNRTLESGLSVLAGMFPPKTYLVGNTLNWLPIPIHEDEKFEQTAAEDLFMQCLSVLQLWYSEYLKNMTENNSEFLKFLEKISGVQLPNPLYLMELTEPLEPVVLHPESHKLPTWINSSTMAKVSQLLADTRVGLLNDRNFRILSAAPHIRYFVSGMENSRNELTHQKFLGYSAHDDNIMAVEAALKIPTSDPYFASYLALELHDRNGTDIVEIWFRNGSDNSLVQYHMGDCPDPCSFDSFAQITQVYTSGDLKSQCGDVTTSQRQRQPNQIYLAVLSTLCGLLLLLTLISSACFINSRNGLRKLQGNL